MMNYSKYLKLSILGALAGIVLFTAIDQVMANNGKSKKKDSVPETTTPTPDDSVPPVLGSCQIQAQYPRRDSGNCSKMRDIAAAELTTVSIKGQEKQVVIFHYHFTDNIELKGSPKSQRTIDTSRACVVRNSASGAIEAIYAMPDINLAPSSVPSDCTGTANGKTYSQHESRVYFYLDKNLTLSGNAGIYHTANLGDGKAGAFRIYGNPLGGAAQEIKFNGNTCIDAFIYAPTALAGINGTGCGITGAVWVNKWDKSNSNAGGAKIIVPDDLEIEFGDDIAAAGLVVPKISNPTAAFQLQDRSSN